MAKRVVKSSSNGEVAIPEKPSKLFRKMSAVLLINAFEFARATPAMQTKTTASAEGLPIEFVADFINLGNKRIIRDNLLSGKDVSRELEFNGITLDAEELRVLNLIKPLLAKIEAIGPAYPWLPTKDFSATVQCSKDRILRDGHTVSKSIANRIWNKASKFWAIGGDRRPPQHDVATDGSGWGNRSVIYKADSVTIGCQSIPRAEVEFIARHYGFDPVVE